MRQAVVTFKKEYTLTEQTTEEPFVHIYNVMIENFFTHMGANWGRDY